MQSKCLICDAPPLEKSYFCSIHQRAYSNLKDAYKVWLKAYNQKLTIVEYLEKLMKLPETGRAVREVISHILGCKERVYEKWELH